MNTIITHVGGQAVSIEFVSGDLSNFGRHLALAARGEQLPDPQGPTDSHIWRAKILAVVCLFFLLGALFAGAAMTFSCEWVLLPPTLILAILAVTAAK